MPKPVLSKRQAAIYERAHRRRMVLINAPFPAIDNKRHIGGKTWAGVLIFKDDLWDALAKAPPSGSYVERNQDQDYEYANE